MKLLGGGINQSYLLGGYNNTNIYNEKVTTPKIESFWKLFFCKLVLQFND